MAGALTLERPAFAVGDSWTYRVTVTEGGATVESGETKVAVVAHGTHAGRASFTLASWTNLTGASGPVRRESVEVRELATGHLLGTGPTVADVALAEAPCKDVQYPMAYGDAWTYDCTMRGGRTERTYQVVGGETLVLEPYGDVEALTVDWYGDDGASRLWYASEACGWRVQERTQVNDRIEMTSLTGSRCSLADHAPPPGTTTTTTTRPTTTTTTPPTSGGTTTITVPPGGAALPFPTHTRGDRWVYDANLEAGGRTYKVNSTIQANDPVDHKLPDGRAVEGRAYLREDGVRLADGRDAFVRSHLTLSRQGAVLVERQEAPRTAIEGLFAPNLTIAYDAPCSQVPWPIVPGSSWDVRCPARLTLEGTNSTLVVTGKGSAGAVRDEKVGDRTFRVHPVTLDLRYGDLFTRKQTVLFSADACWFVHAKPGTLTQEDTLREFSCKATGQGEGRRGSETPGVGTAALLALGAASALALRASKRS